MARPNVVLPPGFWPVEGPLQLREVVVASNYATALYPGDPVAPAADGTYARVAGGGGNRTMGVVTQIIQYKDSTGVVRTNGNYIPANTTYTAGFREETRIQIVVCHPEQLFRVRCSAAAASYAAELSELQSNVDHRFSGLTADPNLGLGACDLDMGTLATTSTLQWRIAQRGSTFDGIDATLSNRFVVVYCNMPFLGGVGTDVGV